ncbi:hypothetical protein F4819DRAFT_465521 [Hypoxylon fuscum]|nr:hypothetical protein F4819DRAFT_465521 [Hypoxylon fuscum]
MQNAIKLHDILCMGSSWCRWNEIVNPPIKVPRSVSRFFDVQQCIDILVKEKVIHPGEWPQESAGFFVDIAGFMNDYRNLYAIPVFVKRAKTKIPLAEYRTSALIQTYLSKMVKRKDGVEVTIESQVKEMAVEMKNQDWRWGKFTKAVGEKLCEAMGW